MSAYVFYLIFVRVLKIQDRCDTVSDQRRPYRPIPTERNNKRTNQPTNSSDYNNYWQS